MIVLPRIDHTTWPACHDMSRDSPHRPYSTLSFFQAAHHARAVGQAQLDGRAGLAIVHAVPGLPAGCGGRRRRRRRRRSCAAAARRGVRIVTCPRSTSAVSVHIQCCQGVGSDVVLLPLPAMPQRAYAFAHHIWKAKVWRVALARLHHRIADCMRFAEICAPALSPCAPACMHPSPERPGKRQHKTVMRRRTGQRAPSTLEGLVAWPRGRLIRCLAPHQVHAHRLRDDRTRHDGRLLAVNNTGSVPIEAAARSRQICTWAYKCTLTASSCAGRPRRGNRHT